VQPILGKPGSCLALCECSTPSEDSVPVDAISNALVSHRLSEREANS
jgi:hypothetical protein